MKYIILVLLCFTTSIVLGQDVIGKPQKKGDSLSLVKKTKPINPKDKLKNDSITLTIEDYKIISFEIEPFAKYCLLNGLDQLDFLFKHSKEIDAYETC